VTTETMMNAAQYEITDGYVGSMGIRFTPATAETLAATIAKAAEYNKLTAAEIEQRLESGKAVAWRKSPNFEYDHSEGFVRRIKAAAKVEMVQCACGHNVPRSHVMATSNGTSCFNCYDRMSN